MMWAMEYIGKPYSTEQDCYYWFRKIQSEQFGREVPHLKVGGARVAVRLMRGEFCDSVGWEKTDAPKDGDAVFMSQAERRNTHIGVAFHHKGKLMVIHALAGMGVVVSDVQGLRMNNLKISSYWTPK